MESKMPRFLIEGPGKLHGSVTPSGNKNSAFPLISASLLTDQPVTLNNLPDIGDIRTMLEIVEDLGVQVERLAPNKVRLTARDMPKVMPNKELFGKTRGALVLMGSLLSRNGRVELPRPGGDQIGRRRIDTHIIALTALGATAEYNGGFILSARQLTGSDILLDEASVTGTENAILGAARAKGTTIIRNAASEPHVQELCRMLKAMGAHIEGIGSNILTIEGVDSLKGTEFTVSSDYLETGSYIGLAGITHSEIVIKNAAPQNLRMIKLVFERLGVHIDQLGENDIYVPADQPLEVIPDIGNAIPKVDDAPWPAFPADMMSVALVVATQSQGTVIIHEKMFESRLYFVDKLISMGARIVLCDPHRAIVQGPCALRGESLSSPDIRAGMALLIAAICAEGRSEISNVGQIDRGYEHIEKKLQSLGVAIQRAED
jgi:UDP-N-acetylglucosamine 1-carboxyvinyltransferase